MLANVEQTAREPIAVTLDARRSEVAVDVSFGDLDGTHVGSCMKTITGEKAQAARPEEDAAARIRTPVNELVVRDVPLRDIGAMLGRFPARPSIRGGLAIARHNRQNVTAVTQTADRDGQAGMAANPDVDNAILETVARSGTVVDPTAGVDGVAFARIERPEAAGDHYPARGGVLTPSSGPHGVPHLTRAVRPGERSRCCNDLVLDLGGQRYDARSPQAGKHLGCGWRRGLHRSVHRDLSPRRLVLGGGGGSFCPANRLAMPAATVPMRPWVKRSSEFSAFSAP
jgi:hypothetical protein